MYMPLKMVMWQRLTFLSEFPPGTNPYKSQQELLQHAFQCPVKWRLITCVTNQKNKSSSWWKLVGRWAWDEHVQKMNKALKLKQACECAKLKTIWSYMLTRWNTFTYLHLNISANIYSNTIFTILRVTVFVCAIFRHYSALGLILFNMLTWWCYRSLQVMFFVCFSWT